MIAATSQHEAIEQVVRAIRTAAEIGEIRIRRPVIDDYEDSEVPRWGRGVEVRKFLVGVSAKAALTFDLPTHAVPDGWTLELGDAEALGRSSLLRGPGIDPEDPVDVVAEALGDEDLLRSLVVPELIDRHSFKTLRGWDALAKRVEATSTIYRAVCGRVSVITTIELEATA